VDNLPYSTYDYAHKHTRQEREREKFTANENTSQIINPYARHTPAGSARPSTTNNSTYSNALLVTTPTSSASLSPAVSPSVSPVVSPTSSPSHPTYTSSSSPPTNSGNSHTKNREKENRENRDSSISVNGRTYECKGIKISTVVDEIKFGK
jgi:hypothetical protein